MCCLFMLCETLDIVNVIMTLPAVCMFHNTTPMITQMKEGNGKVGFLCFLNISINPTYFNIFSASVHQLSPQD